MTEPPTDAVADGAPDLPPFDQGGSDPDETAPGPIRSAEDRSAPRNGNTSPLTRRRLAFADKAEIAAVAVRRESMRAVRQLKSPFPVAGLWRRPVPERLLIAPQDIRTADATIAAEIYAGHLAFGGSFVDAHGRSPFDLQPPSDAWAEELHGFAWLRHLRAANTGLSRANARALVEDWMANSASARSDVAWRHAVVARRILSWLAHSPLVLSPPDAAFYRRFMRSLARQVAFLRRAVSTGAEGEARLLAGIALAQAGLCAEGLAAARKQGSRVLVEELDRQVFADGGHISRNPGRSTALLLDLLPLRQAYAARSAPVPPPLLHAVDRMIPMIRMFRHGDGTLALFNGMGVTEPDALATVLTYDDVRARPLSNAPHAGYQRLDAGDVVLIADTGRPPPSPFDAASHAGTLSFELSTGTQRLIVNCGRPESRSPAAIQAARSTAAHSALVLDDASSSQFAPRGLRRWYGEGLINGPRHVKVDRSEDAGTQSIRASHDGYLGRFGLIHVRQLVLHRSGGSLLGADMLEPGPGAKPLPIPFAIRFHLHPVVRPQIIQGGTALILTLPNGERWLFETDAGTMALDESILFAAPFGARRSSQIVIEATFPAVRAVNWSLARLGVERS